MDLITPADLINVAPFLKYSGLTPIAAALHRVLKLDKINELYGQSHELPADESYYSQQAKWQHST